MTVTIHKLSTLCHAPKGLHQVSSLVDDVARGALPSELGAQLGPSLDRLPQVVRLQNLRVRLKIPSRRWNASTLAEAWARAFTLALHSALAYPDNSGPCPVVRHQTRAAYRAAMLWHIATEGVTPCWQFPELERWRHSSPAAATFGLLLHEQQLVNATLAEAAINGWLDPLLMLWNEEALEQLMQVIVTAEDQPSELSLENLLELARALAASDGLQRQWSFSGRRQAIRLWQRLSHRFSVRSIWHGLRLLRRLLETPVPRRASASALLSDPIPFPSWCEAIIHQSMGPDDPRRATLAKHKASISLARGGHESSRLEAALDKLRPLLPTSASSGQQGRWIVSDNAGVLLMLASVRRLEFWRLAQIPEFMRFVGPRAFSFFLAAMGMTLLGKWNSGDAIEPAVALLAGIFGEADLPGMKQFFLEADVGAMREITAAENWNDAWESAASQVTAEFACRIRGFREASRASVVRQFVRMPGRVLVEEKRLLVVLEPSVWGVALHISRADDRLEQVEWLAEKCVEFVLEGL